MNTFEFFNQNFGRHLTAQTDNPLVDAQKALSMNHKLLTGKTSRLSSGWAIVRPSRSSLQLGVDCSGIEIVGGTVTRYQAFIADLQAWRNEPRIYLTFEKRPVPISNIFVTYDPRVVRICSAKGVETFDFTQPPTAESGMVHKVLYKQMGGEK
jgi:hypothetical protein